MDVKKDYIDIDTTLFSGISTDLDDIKRSYQRKDYLLEDKANTDNVEIRDFLRVIVAAYSDELLVEEQIKSILKEYEAEKRTYESGKRRLHSEALMFVDQKRTALLSERDSIEKVEWMVSLEW